MREQITPAETVASAHGALVCASIEWVDLRDRSARCGDRDAELLAKKDQAMDEMCRPGGLLDKFVFANAFENGAVEVKDVVT